MNGSNPLLFGFLLLVAEGITYSYTRKVKRSLQGEHGSVSWDDEWGRRDVSERLSDLSPWSPNVIGSTSKQWDAGETMQRWSHSAPSSQNIDYDYPDEWQLWSHPAQKFGIPTGGNSTEKHLEAILRGVPGVDFPNYNSIPDTQFDCSEQATIGYYGDVKAECQVFHICQAEGRKDSFLCPLGTIFNQRYFVCDWWFNFNCSDSPQYYELNEHVYKDEKDEDMKMQPWNPPGIAKGVPSKGSDGPAVFRGKSIDEWSQGGKKGDKMPSRDQNSWGKGHVGKVNGNVVWNRSTGMKGVQGTTPRPTFPPAGRTPTKSSGLPTKKNGSVLNNGNIRAWTGSNGRPSLDRRIMNEINATPSKTSRPAAFGLRTKGSSSTKAAKSGSWKSPSESTAKVTPAYGRKALSQNSNNAAWSGNEHFSRKNVPGFTTLSPSTIIRPTGTRGVWEQESTRKTSGSNYTWKLNATYQKGTVRKPSASNLKSDATEINNSVTSSVFSSFGKRKGIVSSNWKTTQKPESIKSHTLPQLNSGDPFVLASTPSIEPTRALESALRENIKEHGFWKTPQIPNTSFTKLQDTGRHEHVLRLARTTVPVHYVMEDGISKITDDASSLTTEYGIRNPKKVWNTNVIPQAKTRN